MSDVKRYTYEQLRRILPPEFNAAAAVWVHASDYDALAAPDAKDGSAVERGGEHDN